MTPKFSVLTPVHDPPEAVLAAMLASVAQQTCGDWEHCLVDDGSSRPYVRAQLEAAAAADPRVKVAFRAESGGIVAATNDAFALGTGEFVALLDHDDELHPDALAHVGRAIDAHPDVDHLYTDEDKIDEGGRHYGLFLKPDWSPERLRSQMYTCHLAVSRRSLVAEVGGWRAGFDGSQDWDLALRVTERARRVVHVRENCYHWRAIEGSAAASSDAKPYAAIAAQRAITEHIDRIGLEAVAEGPTSIGAFRIRPQLRSQPPVSIVVPTGGQVRPIDGRPTRLVTHAVRSIVERTTYPNYEIIVVVDGSVGPDVRREIRDAGDGAVRIIECDRPFNFSERINYGTVHSDGEFVLLLNDDVEVLPEGWRAAWPVRSGASTWLESLVMYARLDAIGAVGARLYTGDLRLQHVGVVVQHAMPAHSYRGFPSEHIGYGANIVVPGNYSAVTAACLMSRRSVFDEVGGLSLGLPLNYNDVDYCMKVRNQGYRIVYDPEVELLHFESSSRAPGYAPHELAILHDRWKPHMIDDPFFHPKFFQGDHDFWPPAQFEDGSVFSG